MFNTLTELFLNTYFLFDVLAGKLIGNGTTLFDKLYSVFLLPEGERETVYNLTQSEIVREMNSYVDYAQLCRIQKFASITGTEGIPADFYDIIAVKGAALKRLKQTGFDEYIEATETGACKLLNDTANMGFISSLCALGFLQCEGIFVSKNPKLGKRNLEKAAQWNSIEGILLSLYYNDECRQKNIDRLHTVTKGTLYEDVCFLAQKAYGVSEYATVPENKLLQKAFGAAILKADVYAPQYARFVFSDVLSLIDKERALFSSHKEAISETADLPLKLICGELSFNPQALDELPLARKKEKSRIFSIVSGADMRTDSSFRPLCVSGDSEYLLNLYIAAVVKGFAPANVERIDIADLSEYDFEPTKNNIFVRSCNEDKQNVYILVCRGDISERMLNAVRSFLQNDKRKKFRLQHPSAIIDLSAVLPICFCDAQNARALKSYCDTVSLASVSAAEKLNLTAHIIHDKAKKYKLAGLQFSQSAEAMLALYSVDRVEYIIDKVVRFNRSGGPLTVTAEMIKEIVNGEMSAKTKYGFGGAINEGK